MDERNRIAEALIETAMLEAEALVETAILEAVVIITTGVETALTAYDDAGPSA